MSKNFAKKLFQIESRIERRG